MYHQNVHSPEHPQESRHRYWQVHGYQLTLPGREAHELTVDIETTEGFSLPTAMSVSASRRLDAMYQWNTSFSNFHSFLVTS